MEQLCKVIISFVPELQESFKKAFYQLNAQQREAVESTEGPVLVVAGAGTGKTQLLSVRVGYILSQRPVEPEHILCLTFTEAAAQNMRQRVMSFVGKQALKIPIFTFHSFAVEMINHYPEYFFGGNNFQPIDDILRKTIVTEIFESLSYDDPLYSYHPELGWTYLNASMQMIGDLKDAGLSPKDFELILDQNEDFLTQIQPLFAELFADKRINTITFESWVEFSQQFHDIYENFVDKPWEFSLYHPIWKEIFASLPDLSESDFAGKGSPLKTFRDHWFMKDTLKDLVQLSKQRSLLNIYKTYQTRLEAQGLYDFSDMLVQLIHVMKSDVEFAALIQERYQYVMIDEFQDTNGAQMEIIHQILNHQVHEGRPNVLVVGDDDQAIYKFNKATVANIQNFQNLYRDVKVITLRTNYRSPQVVIDYADEFISQAVERLAHGSIDKKLISART
jgi:DNA helicase-2/ATP-dependent DNA helicase PcrA